MSTNTTNADYLSSIYKQFLYYKLLGEKTFHQLEDIDLFHRANDESNSIAIIVNHLWGNMLSRWTDFLNSDGEKEWRNRDQEFEDTIKTRGALLERWEEGWKCLFDALESISEDDLGRTVFIRNQGHTVVEAINRQLAHYAYHIGQIVFLGKLIKGSAWESLSIPKGESKEYNKLKFDQERQTGHFTDEYLKEKD